MKITKTPTETRLRIQDSQGDSYYIDQITEFGELPDPGLFKVFVFDNRTEHEEITKIYRLFRELHVYNGFDLAGHQPSLVEHTFPGPPGHKGFSDPRIFVMHVDAYELMKQKLMPLCLKGVIHPF